MNERKDFTCSSLLLYDRTGLQLTKCISKGKYSASDNVHLMTDINVKVLKIDFNPHMVQREQN